MASITITIFTLLLLTISTTIHGRESQFFAKVSNNIPQESLPLNTNTNQQDSKTGDSYGLFGHESGQLPPSTTTTTTVAANDHLPANLPENYNPVAYTTPIHSTQNLPEEFDEPKAFQFNGDDQNENQNQNQYAGNGDNDNEMYNYEKQEVGTNGGNMYNSQKQGMSDTRFLENGKYYYGGDNGYKSPKQGAMNGAMFVQTSEDGGEMYNSQKQENGRYNQGQEMYNSQKQESGRYNQGQEMYNSQKQQESGRYNQEQEMYNSQKQGNNGNMYNTQKQGMSDTRFLESGKYYYDLNSENLNANGNMNSRGFEYNNKGYYGNNDVNSYERYNSNGGYQNQDEFQDDQFNP